MFAGIPVPEGPLVSASEWQAALAHCAGLEGEWLVASGSLARGVPDDFLVHLARDAAARGARLVVDTSGPALKAVLDAGGLFLVKPSQGELKGVIDNIVYFGTDTHFHIHLNDGSDFMVRQQNSGGAGADLAKGAKVGIQIAAGTARILKD